MQYKIFGCKTNKYFTEKWLNSKELENKTGVFVASCVVTDKAKSKWIKFVKDTIKNFESENDKVYLSGCGPIKKGKLNTDFYKVYPELQEFSDKIELLEEEPKEKINLFPLHLSGECWGEGKKYGGRALFTRKYLVIQNGCDNNCTFCLTIQARGSHVSRGIEEIIEEINKTSAQEVVLTGINIGAWGASNTKKFEESKLSELLSQILEKTKVKRIRISSLGIEYINSELLEVFRNTRIYPHFHLSIQSGSDKVLKLMGRNYSEKTLNETLEKLNNLKRGDGVLVSLGADIIVGFPGETDDDFQKSLELIKKYNITKLHAFPFSSHKNHHIIPASKLDNQISDKIKRERMNKISKEAKIVEDNFYKKNNGKILKILIEKVSQNNFSGWSENYIPLNEANFKPFKNEKITRGKIIEGKYEYNDEDGKS
ncbi:radical SAM protein [Candidatus Gracilibacteria bacterium]|nr:radical SAM protein [Candidatus Gracilibacteria bacterium]